MYSLLLLLTLEGVETGMNPLGGLKLTMFRSLNNPDDPSRNRNESSWRVETLYYMTSPSNPKVRVETGMNPLGGLKLLMNITVTTLPLLP